MDVDNWVIVLILAGLLLVVVLDRIKRRAGITQDPITLMLTVPDNDYARRNYRYVRVLHVLIAVDGFVGMGLAFYGFIGARFAGL